MGKTVVYFKSNLGLKYGGDGLLSSGDAMRELGITKVTLYRWIYLRILHPRTYKFGARTFYGFDQEEINKIKPLLPKGRKSGSHLITQAILDKIQGNK